ncbi:MAG: ABC transporter substrate-binding protein [Candidatus Woesearchaeota archaeon]
MKYLYICIAVVLAALITGVSITGMATKNTQEPLIGALLSLSGANAGFGENLRKGLELGLENSHQLVIEDTQSNTRNAVSAAQKLIAAGADILLTEYSEDSYAVIEVAEQYGVPVVCIACGSVGTTEKSELLYSTWPSDAIETAALAEYADSYEHIGIIQTESIWENTLSESFKEQSNAQITHMQTLRDTKSFQTELLRIQNTDIIYAPVYEQRYPLLFKQAKELGIDAQIMTTSWINEPNILQACASVCEGAIVPQYAKPNEAFVKQYEEMYGEKPGTAADIAYDTGLLINAYLDQEEPFRVFMQDIQIQGATGTLSFDATGARMHRDVNLYVIQNQKLVEIQK